MSTPVHDPERRLYSVHATLLDRESTAALLSVVSVLHRRAAVVGEAELSPAADGQHRFRATFTATERQAHTVRATLDNVVDVLEVQLVSAAAC